MVGPRLPTAGTPAGARFGTVAAAHTFVGQSTEVGVSMKDILSGFADFQDDVA